MRLRNNPKAYEIMNENSDFVVIEPENLKNNWNDIFDNDKPIYIEIGMGKGDFIFQNACNYPDINFIGIEKYPSVLAAAINKIKQKEKKVTNLRLMRYDAIELEKVFSENEVDKIFLNFSDPWPKSRHAKRRLTSNKFLDVYRKILVDDGVIEFKTDNRSLFEYSLISLNQYPMDLEYVSLDLHNSPENESNIMTEYERKFCTKGPIYKLVARYRKNG
ncbi:tRNA (guanosine(46)-N7)-methyltransferase TrmB [Thomasclavelia cocleata]|uniref:tRNA (guanine-N(7)-)-methyltransferase n=1 Tax=Thomasclavelia cocleata TaxID=69824 RepID=A0A829ZCV1_9FIRM|nr:tRNA (guanosine(46)-N7)-methyltransferase TrmB [Thomasclavelia cocleata]MCI9130415.1 tRNA (guanosine(46)-N7)-methyltransferase TrmB [Thomasclavelia cocleata]GFI41822.1 tRNA (guanine-N(7)-)-methyltransferase [Thomasclavelia cocleata]